MDDMDGMSVSIVEKIFALLPIMLIGMIIFGNVLFAAVVIFPAWQAHEEIVAQIAAAQQTLDDQAGEQDENVRVAIIQNQVDSAQTLLEETAGQFLTADQADQLLSQLYVYAQETQVEIASLRSQPPVQPAPDTQLYEIRLYRLQITGPTTQLLQFLVRIREAAAAGVILNNISISQSQGVDTLMMDVSLYVSPLANGTALSELPEAPGIAAIQFAVTPAPDNTEQVTDVTGTAFSVLPDAVPTIEVVVTSVGDYTLPAADASCPGAPETLFAVGDTVIVDFNQNGALRILARVDAPDPYVETRAQAYDDQQLHILAGPVCGTWNGRNIWYWFVEREGFGSYQGWAAEASLDDRWMCPLSNPECSE